MLQCSQRVNQKLSQSLYIVSTWVDVTVGKNKQSSLARNPRRESPNNGATCQGAMKAGGSPSGLCRAHLASHREHGSRALGQPQPQAPGTSLGMGTGCPGAMARQGRAVGKCCPSAARLPPCEGRGWHLGLLWGPEPGPEQGQVKWWSPWGHHRKHLNQPTWIFKNTFNEVSQYRLLGR